MALGVAGTTASSAASFSYDVAVHARVEVQEGEASAATQALVGFASEWSAVPSIDAQGTFTTPAAAFVATNAVRYDPHNPGPLVDDVRATGTK
jgi:hypothetical protein